MQDMKIRFSTWLDARRLEGAVTLETIGRKIGSHKGYISGIINEKVNPPSAKMCAKIGKLFHANPDYVTFMAFRDKAPAAVRDRIQSLDQLKEAMEDYRARSMAPQTQMTPEQHSADLADSWNRITRALNRLNTMWPQPTNGNGNGNGGAKH